MAPECLLDNVFTKQSDVYSYGMVMWELLTAQTPFGAVQSPVRIMKLVLDGGRPPLPASAHAGYGSLVQQCWQLEPERRPLFPVIVQRLEQMLASPSQ